jgi:hypothetical protein
LFKKTVDKVAYLSNESLVVEKGFRDIIDNGKALAEKHKANIIMHSMSYHLA